MARQHQNKKHNLRNSKKQSEIEQHKHNTFLRDFKRCYGPRLPPSTSIKDEDDALLDVEISYHEIANWLQTISESSCALYEVVSSPIVYYNIYDMTQMQTFRKIVWNVFDYIRLSESYYSVACRNSKKLRSHNANRANRDPKRRVKILFLVWRCLLKVEWLIQHQTVHNMPLYLPYLIHDTMLLNETERGMFMEELTNGINVRQYRLNKNFEVLCDKLEWALETLSKRIHSEKQKSIDNHQANCIRKMHSNALEYVINDIIQSFDIAKTVV